MPSDIEQELKALYDMTTTELAERYAELHGQPTRTRHRAYLIRKIAWRIQANAEGDLSERARKRAAELANDADVRVMSPRPKPGSSGNQDALTANRLRGARHRADLRMPSSGTAIVREYKGRRIRVLVLPEGEGFDWEGERYPTISAVAKAVTGSHINGFRFFKLGGKG